MFYIIPNRQNLPADEKKRLIIEMAYNRVAVCRLSPSMESLDAYLKQQYGYGLKTACKRLIAAKTKVSCDIALNQFIVAFTDKDSDDLAKLITYGNREVQGCGLLRFAFSQNY